MDDGLAPIEDLRELVLSVPVQQVMVEAYPINCHPSTIEIDTSSSFVTDEAYKNHVDFIKWAHIIAAKLQFAIVIENSNYGSNRRKSKLVLGC
jgi:hypothetical protein